MGWPYHQAVTHPGPQVPFPAGGPLCLHSPCPLPSHLQVVPSGSKVAGQAAGSPRCACCRCRLKGMSLLGLTVLSFPSGAGAAASGPFSVDGGAAPALWGYPGNKCDGVRRGPEEKRQEVLGEWAEATL